MAILQPEIRRPSVSEKLFTVPDENLVNAGHRRFCRSVTTPVGVEQFLRSEVVLFEKGRDPLETPFQRTHHTIFIPRRKPCFPPVHPTRVRFLQHGPTTSLSAGESWSTLCRAGGNALSPSERRP